MHSRLDLSQGHPASRQGRRRGVASLVALILLFGIFVVGGTLLDGLRDFRPNDGFNAFWRDFRRAVVYDDSLSIRNKTQFPVVFGDAEEGSERFKELYDHLFNTRMRECVASERPTKQIDGRYFLACDPFILLFAQDSRGKWRFSEFGLYE
jgi:hypothetical protein